ncbi:copper-binding protein [Klebsiella michiganensis]|mgnify:FL=1|uniref:copper-binding protein n=1 Tax=Klebsiella michiganensis TaxID=1134687 RepID=UPI000A3D0478|nr:copper-binding protein [Klebsiella michiganensis]ELC0836105.1 copper-binding protein [Klebsiella michiganensis]ELF4768993.1 copper-binding protein [Klebsiella michiganensis]ELP0292812.1 copper-binding protein [Klebsiella michiganensis]MBD0986094.1 copper-binding protein [Klebsiella michiganensis]MBK4128104.1 copper-binding protein [Klebsiella michiganensis]
MRSTSIFLLITSVLTFSFSAFTASAEDAAMHHHTMSSMADMPEMKKADDSATLYSASGVIKAWRDDAVVIAHSPVTELSWPAMTMSFALADNHDKKLAVGAQVDFTFRQTDSGYAIVSITAR